MTEKQYCSICQMEYEGIGNNALPINDGRACDRCDAFIVVPARLQLVMRDMRRQFMERVDEGSQ